MVAIMLITDPDTDKSHGDNTTYSDSNTVSSVAVVMYMYVTVCMHVFVNWYGV